MEINITALLKSEDFCPFDLSNNRATLGDNAGAITWAASIESAKSGNPPCLLNTEEKRQAFRDFVKESGGWEEEEINAWTETELYALFLQWVAGDIRDAFGDANPDEWDWDEYEEGSQAGRVASSLFKSEDGQIYFYVGN
jgi:hypothetical protein